jgi:hypothetical protein
MRDVAGLVLQVAIEAARAGEHLEDHTKGRSAKKATDVLFKNTLTPTLSSF